MSTHLTSATCGVLGSVETKAGKFSEQREEGKGISDIISNSKESKKNHLLLCVF